MNLAAIIVAGGLGKRFGSAKPKQFLLLNKKPMFLDEITLVNVEKKPLPFRKKFKYVVNTDNYNTV